MALISYPAPMQGKVKHELRDTDREPVSSILSDLRYEATMSASESHCHDVAVPVSVVLAQRSQTSKVFREVYHVSKTQSALRTCQSWMVKRKVEFNHNSRNPKIAQRLTMDPNRGIRMTEDRLLSDGTPNPGYVVEWAVGLQSDMKTGGSLLITKEVAKYIQGLKKDYCKFYGRHFNILSNQKEYTVAIYRYMMYLGVMEKGDYLCINQDRHDHVKQFDTEELMRAHWLECHQIQLDEIFLMMLVPDMCKEPANVPHLNLPGVSGTQVALPGPSGTQVVLQGPSVTQVVLPGTNPGVRSMVLPVPPAKDHKGRGRNSGRGGKGGGKGGDRSSDTPPTESAPDTEPAAESTATDRPDILDLTTEDLEVEAEGDIGEIASLEVD